MEKGDSTLQKEEDILEHATEYYKTLFGPSEKPLFDLDLDCWKQEERITEEENEDLTKPFSLKEIRVAIFTMETNTTPGPDHIPVEFYQKSWDSIKLDLFDMLTDFWGHKLDLGRLNYGIVTLTPKMKEANKIQQYRPICLLHVSFKIITKILMLRFENCMSKIIHRCQSAFIKGRNIMDGVMTLHEILHDVKHNKRDGVILKLDFEKVYDKIS
jgi:hypothetical protein